MLLTTSKDCYEVTSILVGLGALDCEELVFSDLSDSVVIAEDLQKGLANVVKFLLIHLCERLYFLRKNVFYIAEIIK